MEENEQPKEGQAKTEDAGLHCTYPGCDKVYNNPNPARNKVSMRAHMIMHKKEEQRAKRRQAIKQPAQAAPLDVSAARARSETATETLEEKIARLRKERTPIGAPECKWSCPKNDGYQYRVFNDDWVAKPGNIQAALAAGYEFVESTKEKEKPKIVGTNDNGTPIRGFLMRIPKVLYDEDQKAKQKIVDRIDEQIKAGSLQQGAGDNRYIPAAGIKISSDNRPLEI